MTAPAESPPGPGLIVPGWPAPASVRAASTTRVGGTSAAPHDSLNLGIGCGDDADAVARNRELVRDALGLPAAPRWLRQVHGASVVDAAGTGPAPAADAALTGKPGVVCAVMSADCLPVLLCDRDGTRVGAVHAGWRGMAAGVIEACVARMGAPEALLAWLGPAIGPRAYEVGPEVREALVAGLGQAAADAFAPSPTGRWLADLYALARLRLDRVGVTAVYGGGRCTHSESDTFFSHRRDGVTGRMASLVWLTV